MSSLPRLLGDGLLGSLIGGGTGSSSTTQSSLVSRGFEIFCGKINRRMGKHEMDQTVMREITALKENLSQPNVSMSLMRDYLCRVVYCDMLGYDMSWAYIHAVKLAQQGSNLDKKIGYLACSLLLYRDHELILLLVNTIQKDLKSSNILDNMVAMAAAGQLVPSENIPMLLPLVLEKLRHSRELVRQRAVVTLHQFLQLAPDIVNHCQEIWRKALFDKDPGVMAAAVNLTSDHIKQQDPQNQEALTEGLMSILKQVMSRKMPSMFEYHSVPAPWLQIKLIRTLACLCQHNTQYKKSLFSLLEEIVQKVGVRENISFAILYECLQCMLVLQPGRQSVELVADQVKRFINSSEPNLKFIGMKVLMGLVETDERYVAQYQSLILDSLDNPDLNVKKKMHRLLFKIANKSNGSAVCTQLLQQIAVSSDKYWRLEVVSMVIQLVQRFNEPQEWQIKSLIFCLEVSADLIDQTHTRDVINYLDKDIVSNENASQTLRGLLVQICITALQPDNVTAPVVNVCAWALGELAPLMSMDTHGQVISLITRHMKNSTLPVGTLISLLTALQKMAFGGNVDPVTMAACLKDVIKSNLPVVVKQRLTLLYCVCDKNLKITYSVDVAGMDTTLSFLDDHVSQCLEAGQPTYIPSHLRKRPTTDAPRDGDVSLYSMDTGVDSGSGPASVGRHRTGSTTSSNRTSDDVRELQEPKLPSVKKIWSRQGRQDPGSISDSREESQTVKSDMRDHHQQLAKALFSGIPAVHQDTYDEGKSNITDENDEEDQCDEENNSNITSSSNSKWRSLHSSPLIPGATCFSNFPSDNGRQFLIDGDDKNGVRLFSDSLAPNFVSPSPVAMTTKDHSEFSDSLNEESTFSLDKGENSSFLNISVSSNDESRVSVTHVDARAGSRQSGQNLISDGASNDSSLYGTIPSLYTSQCSEPDLTADIIMKTSKHPKTGVECSSAGSEIKTQGSLYDEVNLEEKEAVTVLGHSVYDQGKVVDGD